MRMLFHAVVVSLVAVGLPRLAIAQDLSFTFVGTNLMEMERPRGMYPEVDVAFTMLGGGTYDLLVSAHVATWRGRHHDFRCADFCPDQVFSAQLVGARIGVRRSEGRVHVLVSGGPAILGGHDIGHGVVRMTVLQSVASLGVDVVRWLRPTAAFHLRQPVDGSRRPAIGRISFGLGVTASFR